MDAIKDKRERRENIVPSYVVKDPQQNIKHTQDEIDAIWQQIKDQLNT